MSCLFRTRMPLSEEERARRIIDAVLSSLDGWYEQAMEISDAAIAVTGNKARGLHLAKSLAQAKLALEKLARQLDD
jgi:hypothetical protein